MPTVVNRPPYKACPICGQAAAMNAPQCGRCGHVYQTQFTPPLNQTQVFQPIQPIQAPSSGGNSKGFSSGVIVGIGTCCGLPILGFLILMLMIGGRTGPHKHDDGCALILSREAVKQRLQAPATADFADSYQSHFGTTPTGHFVVSSFVDSQNGFGAKIRTYYRCELHPNSEHHYLDTLGAGGWTIDDLTFE